jgi:hypothetical protein
LSNIAIALNIIKIIPLFPTILPKAIKAGMKMFFVIKEQDVLSSAYNDEIFYPLDY